MLIAHDAAFFRGQNALAMFAWRFTILIVVNDKNVLRKHNDMQHHSLVDHVGIISG